MPSASIGIEATQKKANTIGIVYRGLPGIGLKLSGGVRIGGKVCTVDEAKKWSPILPPDSPHIQGLGQFAVDEFNRKHENNLKFEKVYGAWTWKVDQYTTKYRLFLTAIDCLGRLLSFEAVVVEKTNGGLLIKSLESFVEINV